MNNYGNHSLPKINHCENGSGTAYYLGGLEYTGNWANGKKIGEGKLVLKSVELIVKIKEGQIFKCIRILNNPRINTAFLFPIPQLKYTEVSEWCYKEEYLSTETLNFGILNNQILFNGKPYLLKSIIDFKTSVGPWCKGDLKDQYSQRSILDIRFPQSYVVAFGLNFTFNGEFKLANQHTKAKGIIKGHYFLGPCTVKYPKYKIIFNFYLNKIIPPIKVVSQNLNIELFPPLNLDSLYDIKNLNNQKASDHQLAEIFDLIQES